MGVPVFLILYFTGEELFSFVFGEAWRPSGHYAKILAFLMTMRFIAVPLSITMSAFEKQKYNLIITLFQLLIMIMLFLISSLLMLDIDSFLTLFSRAMFFFYFLVFLLSYKIALKGDGN
jgi:O-antigen/teichoic acid export membrane protein